MVLLANLLNGVGAVLGILLSTYLILLLGRVIVSWVNADGGNVIVRFLFASTEPVLAPLRRRLPQFGGGIDFSPLFALLLIYFLQAFLVQSLVDYASVLRLEALRSAATGL